MNRTKFVLVGVAALVVAGSVLWWFRFSGDPAATTPTFGLLQVRQPSANWGSVGPNPSGNFEVLPNAFPNAGLRFSLYAPYPTVLSIDLDGQTLSNIPSGGATSTTGYFRVVNVNTNFNPAQWTIEIQPPDSKASSTMMTFNIADVSLNPRFTGTDYSSTPVTVILVARKDFTVSVALSGIAGKVTSNPPGIDCGPTCAFDFGQSFTVTLTPYPASGSTFAGWSGDCASAGSVGNCTLTLNGTAMSVGAAFRPENVSNPAPAICTQPHGDPLCQPSVDNPGGIASCVDNNGWFCCSTAAQSNPNSGCPTGTGPAYGAVECPPGGGKPSNNGCL
jgi:hypothetical protein